MKKKYINDLANLYVDGILHEGAQTGDSNTLNENVEVSPMTSNINDAAGLAPADSGPNVSGLQSPVDNGDNDEEGISNQNITQNQKEEKKSENLNEKSINNSNMSNKGPNIFDKLYATIMEAEDLEEVDLENGLGDEQSPDEDLNDLGIEDDAGGDEITLSLPRDIAEKLHDALMSQLGGDDEEFDDLGDDSDDELDFDSEESLMEAGETKASGMEDGGKPKAATDGKATLQSKKHEVKSTVKPKGGSADGGASGQDGDGSPKACNVGANKHLSNPKGSNKVADLEWG
jgi:hypothetical protein